MPTELQVINDMLAATGTQPVTAANTKHPMYVKANTKLQLLRGDMLKMGLWFNTAIRTLEPDSEGQVYLPSNLVSFEIIDTNLRLTRRGNRVYDLNAGNFDIGCALKIKLIEDVDHDDLPRSANDYLRAKAVYEFYVNEEGTEPRLSQYRDQQNTAFTLMWRDHIRNLNLNSFDNLDSNMNRLKQHSTVTHGGGIYRPE